MKTLTITILSLTLVMLGFILCQGKDMNNADNKTAIQSMQHDDLSTLGLELSPAPDVGRYLLGEPHEVSGVGLPDFLDLAHGMELFRSECADRLQ